MITDKEIEELGNNYAKPFENTDKWFHNKSAFINGFKAAQSKLYSEEDLKYYAEHFALYIQKQKRPEGLLTGWHNWFKNNKNKY